jgi:capsular exopolysaccharide synthesis family protein
MAGAGPDQGHRADWIRPPGEDAGVHRIVETLREHVRLIVVVTVLTTAAALAYVAGAPKVYQAQTDLLITPVPSNDTTLAGLGLIRDSSDPTRDVETAARLVTTPDVAGQARRLLRVSDRPSALLDKVRADPVAQSNIVTITASVGSASGAQQLANAFGDAAVAQRTDQLHRQLDILIPRLQAQIGATPGAQRQSGPDSLPAKLSELQTLRQGPDPTIRVETRALEPLSPSSPRKSLSLAVGLLGGLVLGVGGAFAMQLLDPRLRREDQLHELYRLPVLARIPRQRRRRRGAAPLKPDELSPLAIDGYRKLRAALVSSNGQGHARSVLVTGPSLAEGKTTTSINLAASLAAVGRRVVLVEADLRRPTIGTALGLKARHGINSVVAGQVPVRQALLRSGRSGSEFDLLLTDRSTPYDEELLSLPRAHELMDELKASYDWVVVDSPPLNSVADVMPIARSVDDLVFVVRVGRSNLMQLQELGGLVAQHEIEPAGFVVVGVDARRSRYSEYYG